MDRIIIRVTNLPTNNSNAGSHVVACLDLAGYSQIIFTDRALGKVKEDLSKNLLGIYYLNSQKLFQNYLKIIKIIYKTDVSVVSIHNYKYILLRFIFPRVKMTYHFHGLDQKLLKYSLIGRMLFDKFEMVFSVFKIPYDRAKVIPNFKPMKISKRLKGQSCNRLIFVGRIDLNKNLEFLLKYVQSSSLDSLSLEIYGDGPESKRLQDSYGTSAIRFFGHVGHDLVIDRLANNDVLVLPSLSEGDPKVVKEALMSGLKVVVRDTLRHIGDFPNLYYLDMKCQSTFALEMSRVLSEDYLDFPDDSFLTLNMVRSLYQRNYDGLF